MISEDGYYSPLLEGSAFTGWYTDAALTKPFTQDGLTSEFADRLTNNELHLYAGYTSDIYTITMNSNGGRFVGGSDGDTKDFLIPKGEAIYLNGCVFMNADGSAAYRVKAWHESGTDKVIELTSDGFYVPDGNISVYPEWTEPLPEMELNLNADDDFYLDSEYKIRARLYADGTYNPDDVIFESHVDVYDMTGSESGNLDEKDPVAKLTGNEFITWDVENEEITLHGPAVREELDKLQAKKEDIRLLVYASVKLDSGECITNDSSIVFVKEPYTDYGAENMCDDEELVGMHMSIEKERSGHYYSGKSDSWEGEEFTYEVLSVEVNGKKLNYDEEDMCWGFSVVKGENVVKFTHYAYDPATGGVTDEIVEEQTSFKGVTDKYSIDISNMSSGVILPEETMTLDAYGEHTFMDAYGEEDYDTNFTIKWEITEGKEYASIVKTETIDEDGSRVTIKAKDGIEEELFDEDGEIDVKVEAHLVAKGSVVRSEDRSIIITDYYDEFVPDVNGNKIDRYMPVDSEVTLTPAIKKHELVNGKPVITLVDDLKYGWDFDPAVLEITSGDESVSVYDGTEETFYTGPFTVKRVGSGDCDWELGAYRYYEEDGWQDVDYFDGSMDEMFRFDEMNPEVYGLKNKTYNGKTQTKTLELLIDDPFDGGQWYLDEGEAYKLVYKNNKNVGTATVEIVGLNEFNGSYIKKTFKINPKGTTLSKVAAGKKSFTATWKKQTAQTTGYQIQYGLKSNFKGAKTKAITKNKTYKATIKSLKSKKYYYVRIRTYKTVGKTKYYSAWSKAKKVKIK